MSVGTVVLDELSTAVDRLASLDPAALGDGETVVALHWELERLAAVATRAGGTQWPPSTPAGPGTTTPVPRPCG